MGFYQVWNAEFIIVAKVQLKWLPFPTNIPLSSPTPPEKEKNFLGVGGEVNWKKAMCPIKILVCGIFWLRQPRCSWHIMTLGSINCEFCASKWLLVFKNSLLLLKLAFDFDPLIL